MSIDSPAADEGRVVTPRRKQMRAAVAKFQEYVATYSDQAYFDDYTNKTYLEDMLYGICLSMQELFPADFKGPGGFERFKQHLREHLK